MKARLEKTVVARACEGAEDPERVTVPAWTLHDLRRTVRTRLSAIGVLPVVAELVIGHKQTGIAAIYDLHRYDAEKRDALTRWEATLRSIVAPEPEPDNVVRLRAGARS